MEHTLGLRELRTRGRARQIAEIIGEIDEEDLAELDVEKGVKPIPVVTRISDRHHALARALASGTPEWEAAYLAGYTLSRVSVLKGDPTFKELVAYYKKELVEPAYADLHQRLAHLSTAASELLLDKLEEGTHEDFTVEELDRIIKTGADRTGHGPTATTTVNVNVGLAKRLDEARARLAALEAEPRPADTRTAEGGSRMTPDTVDLPAEVVVEK